MESSAERRRHPRYDVNGLAGVLDGFRLFEALMLSLGGMLIRLPAELALEQEVRVEMALGGDSFRTRARVVFFGPDLDGSRGSEGRFRVGLAFIDPPANDRALLERYIAEQLAGRPR